MDSLYVAICTVSICVAIITLMLVDMQKYTTCVNNGGTYSNQGECAMGKGNP